MQTQATSDTLCIVNELHANGMKAYNVCDNLDWGKGEIHPQSSFLDSHDQLVLLEGVLNSLEPVRETTYSACTDGRKPVRLLDGEQIVPVREQLAGADLVSAFYVAESLGGNFYKDADAPVAQRVKQVAEFLRENGLNPSGHLGCGAATNFLAIAANTVSLVANEAYIARLQALLPEGVYNTDWHADLSEAVKKRLETGVYQDLTIDTFLQAVEQLSGKHGIEELRDDGRGIHGHVEEQIIRIKAPGVGINEQKLAELTSGREVFAINDTRLERIARLFGRGKDKDYRVALMALEDFTDAAHATLAQGLPTYIVEPER